MNIYACIKNIQVSHEEKKSMCNNYEDLPNNECKTSEWEVVLGAPDRVNIPCLMHDTHHKRILSLR